MNMLARAAGFQNLQHLRSVNAAERSLQRQTEDQQVDFRSVERALHQFDNLGRLRRWPSKRKIQILALWALWSRLPAGRSLPEPDVNAILLEEHLFDDPATLRRMLISLGVLARRSDGTDYRRVEQEPPADAKALIHALSMRRRQNADMNEALADA